MKKLIKYLLFIFLFSSIQIDSYSQFDQSLQELSKKYRTERYDLIKSNNQNGVVLLTKSYLDKIDSSLKITKEIELRINLLMVYIEIGMSALYNGYDSILNYSYAKEIISLATPISDIWKKQSWCVFPACFIAQRNYESTYLDSVIKYHPNPEVRERTVYDIIEHANYERKYDVVKSYYEYFLKTFPASNYSEILNKQYGRDKKIKIGNQLPDFEVINLETNEKINLKSLSGKYYLIDVWATWCAPCIAEMENLHNVYNKFKIKNFNILSLSFDANREIVNEFRQNKWKLPWLNSLVPAGINSKLSELFEISYIPKTILIDTNGMIIAIDRELRGENLEKTLTKYVK